MRKITVIMAMALVLCGALATSPALATVAWTDWTSASPSQVTGVMTLGSDSVDVTFSGTYYFTQVNGTGTNYWIPSTPYISATVPNAPPDSDIIGLGAGGTATITFSQPVHNPLLALVSWNGNVVDFGVPIEILSSGPGYWGNGTFTLNSTGTGFTGNGEVHGVIELPGDFSSISFTHTSEYWHGFTVGAQALAVPIPLPPSVILLSSSLLGLAGLRLRRKHS